MLSASIVLLLLAGAGVALVHALLPDHWMPVAVIARAQQWPLARTARMGVWTGVGHVLGSLALGVVVIALGYGLKGTLRFEGPIVGMVLVLSGLGIFLWSLRRPGHTHPPGDGHQHEIPHSHAHEHSHPHGDGHSPTHPPPSECGPHPEGHRGPRGRRAVWLVPVGIAASPDPTILPVFLAAVAVSVQTAVVVLLVYSLVTVVVMAGLTVAAAWGGYRVQGRWLEHHANQVTATVLVVLGLAAWLTF